MPKYGVQRVKIRGVLTTNFHFTNFNFYIIKFIFYKFYYTFNTNKNIFTNNVKERRKFIFYTKIHQ